MENAVFILCLLFYWVANVCSLDSLLSPKGVNYEVAALMGMKREMRDENHVLDGWDINSVDPCTWNMVACSPRGLVITLEMGNMGLSGTLSPSVGNLTNLQIMLLQNNQLSGYLPAEIGKLSELQTLDLSGNQLFGEIPASFGDLTNLSYMALSRNKLSGKIPSAVANLSGLSFLDLSFNNLSGPTPKILATGYSVAGNNFLCPSLSAGTCTDAPKLVNDNSTYRNVSNHHSWLVSTIVGISCIFVVSVAMLACWIHCYRSRLLTSYVQQDYEFHIGNLQRFSFREIQAATNNFSHKNIVGHGGFGLVYKGYLANKTVVAVKRLRDPNFTGEVQFQTEVEMIGLALHRNLLRLYGFCMTPEERLLVYPFMPNGSVADRLNDTASPGKPCLDWRKRTCIALGAARGLSYLHEQCNPKIIHRDVKAANVLLDESFEAVVGDFGLAKLLEPGESHVTTAVRGTIGHIAPEYLSTGQSSDKTDVFGFGILLLEITAGPKPSNGRNGLVQKGMILDWVRKLYDEKRLDLLVDGELQGCYDVEELEEMVELALRCTQPDPSLRPKMSEVLPILEAIAGQIPNGRSDEAQDAGDQIEGRGFNFCQNLNNPQVGSSFKIEAMELSGPR